MKLRNKDKYSLEIDNQIRELALCVLDNITDMYYEDLIVMAEFLNQSGFVNLDDEGQTGYMIHSKYKGHSIFNGKYSELKEIFDIKKYTR